jgi:hypothetical protein
MQLDSERLEGYSWLMVRYTIVSFWWTLMNNQFPSGMLFEWKCMALRRNDYVMRVLENNKNHWTISVKCFQLYMLCLTSLRSCCRSISVVLYRCSLRRWCQPQRWCIRHLKLSIATQKKRNGSPATCPSVVSTAFHRKTYMIHTLFTVVQYI